MNKQSHRDTYVAVANDKLEEFTKGQQPSLFQSPENYGVLMNAFNKYRLAVKQHIDPSINNEESVLLLAALIEQLADSLPTYVDNEPRARVSFFQKTRKRIFQFTDFFKQQIVK
ncbi:hypothetical protein NUACC21_74180 [Scytonema sp. NUACC21]